MINIKDKKDCCGCGACYNVCPKGCIKMSSDEEGFLYPEVDAQACVSCGLCEKVCPIINKIQETPKSQNGYVVQNKVEQVLKESTSGGAFTAIAEYVIENGGIVFGAAFDDDFKVIHTYAETKDALKKFRNSKYVQSDTKTTFRQALKFLQDGRMVCFSGTPCQIEGLKSFLGREYNNLLTVDLVCRATPSPLIWEKYKRYAVRGNNLIEAHFRSKEPYGYDYSQMNIKTNKSCYNQGVETDPYLRAFFSDLSDRPSCYSCPFKKRYRVSDITLWDCLEPIIFDKTMDNNKGVTRVLLHSAKGKDLFDKILEKMKYKEISADKLVEDIQEMFLSVPVNPKRSEFFKDASRMNDSDFFEKYFPDTMRIKAERCVRHITFKLGIYKKIKRLAKKILK